MKTRLKLFSPLSEAAGVPELTLTLQDGATLKTVVEVLVGRFGDEMRQHLFDTEGRLIPSWAVFLNQRVIMLNQPGALETPVFPRDEITFILNIAGG
jgi:molybdopterin converting factor small subunit